MAGSTSARVVSQPMKSRAHHCFQLQDITAFIVKEMTDGSPEITRSSRKNLAVFARICHSTVDPALRALWRQQTGMDNLIRTLPTDVWKKEWMGRVKSEESGDGYISGDEVTQVHMIGKKREVYSLNRPLSSFEWQRFDYYAAFIKQLYIGEDGFGSRSMEWSPDVSSALQFHRLLLGRPLLPNLEEFTLNGDHKDLFSAALFLPPTLKRISVNSDCDVPWTQSFLSYFPDMSPKLEYLEINRSLLITEPVDIHPLLSCVRLRSLEISGPRVSGTESALRLAQLPNLEALSLSFIKPRASQNPSPHRSNPYIFRRVKSLECNSSPEFLQAGRFPVLESFTIRDGSGIRDSLDALWKHCSPNRLCDFAIICITYDLTLEDIQTVFDFHKVEHFTIITHRWIWNDNAVELMASAWSGLRGLFIDSTLDPYGFTLLGLVHLTKWCPQLRSLYIPIREQNPPISLSDLPEDGPSNVHLESVAFSGAKVEQSQCDTVAVLLSCLFPNLRRISTWGSDTSRISDGWKRVEELLEKFRAVRNYNRSR